MKTVMITSEVTPYSRTGILGDAVAGLSKGLSHNGIEVCVISPLYLCMELCAKHNEQKEIVTVSAAGVEYSFTVYSENKNGVNYVFLYNEEMFSRRYIYGAGDFDFSDNDIRFGIFSLASLEYIKNMAVQPEIIHCHEWCTGLVPIYRNLYYEEVEAKIIFTAHNISFQGIFGKYSIQALGLPWSIYNIEELEYYEGISFLKGGMVHADYVTVPSPTYAEDIKTEEFSQGFGLFLADLSHKLEGITGGIDYARFNPSDNKYIESMYSEENIDAKAENKKVFLAESNLKDDNRPLFLVETRFIERKGLELIIETAEELSKLDANFAFLGYGEPYLCTKFKEMGGKYQNMYTFIGNSESMVQKAYSAADFVLRPSLSEPGGNSHLKGMRFGALPVVSKTGGHIDTVVDIEEDGYGFFIKEYSRQELKEQILRALAFFGDKPILAECMKRVMQIDFSWRTASLKYIELYRKLLGGSYES